MQGIPTLHFADMYEKNDVDIAELNKSNLALLFVACYIATEWPLEV